MPSNKLRIPQFHYKCNYYIAKLYCKYEIFSKKFCYNHNLLGKTMLLLTKEKRRKSLICSVLLILTFGSSGTTRILEPQL